MSRHRTPLERPDRESDLIAPVIAIRPRPDASAAEATVPTPRRAPDTPKGRHAARPEPDAAAGRHRTAAASPAETSDVTPTGGHHRSADAPAADQERTRRHRRSEQTADLPAAGRRRRRADGPTPDAAGQDAATRDAGTPSDAGASDDAATPDRTATVTARHDATATVTAKHDVEATGTARHDATATGTARRDVEAAVSARHGGTGTARHDATATVTAKHDVEATAGRADTALLAGAARPRHAADSAPRKHRRVESRHVENRPAGRRHSALRGGNRRRSALVLVTVAAGLLALPTVSSAAGDQCRWQRAAHNLLVSLGNRTDDRSDALRTALIQAGVGPQLPSECAQRTSQAAPATTPSPTTSATRPTSTKPTASSTTRATSPDASNPTTTTKKAKPTTGAAATPDAPAVVSSAGTGSTAADAFGWGAPMKSDDFAGGLGGWGVYNGAGHGGNGRRTPDAAKVVNGVLTITGDSNGNSAGMAWGDGQKYGRWEARVRSTAGDDSYHPVMLLWPDAENWPVGGEVDWMEISDADRQSADGFLHYGASNSQVSGSVKVDATQWHNWAVEWSPQGITYYLDGKVWWKTANTSILPPGPMHMTIQLDYFGGGNPKASQMMVDWVHQYKM